MKILTTLIAIIGFSFTFQDATLPIADQDTKIIMVESANDVKHLNDKKEFTVAVSKSLNLATSKTIKKLALEKLKAKAEAKGFTHLLIEDTESGMSISKRNYKVTLTGVAYK